ncbi:hypothetical protein SAMN05443544_0625 [Agromyces cerinus subsp. cerinus]|uniref:Uncharacterized protein n=2 Tax=Agromyces cerinus TaxID=33878 RepID=A0A1N6DR33_9MICO|nr:hypothetical protein SAMN05443544_0625 [Agromyces cerinus subsp. cerinus]
MHNPYPSIVLAIGLVGVGVFVLNKLGTESIGAWCVAGFFWLMGTTTLVLTAIRIPGWHKARRGVRRHIRVNGGEMPDDLKWYR